jgi:ubiquilin
MSSNNDDSRADGRQEGHDLKAEASSSVTISIRLVTGESFPVVFPNSRITVGMVKEAIASQSHAALDPPPPVSQQRLIYKGSILHDSSALLQEQHGIPVQDNATLFLVILKNRPASSPAVAPPAPVAAAAATVSAATPSLPIPLLPTNSLGVPGGSMNPFLRNPNGSRDMNSLLDDPIMSRLMDSIPPEMMMNMIQSQMNQNPSMQRLMDSNPLMREALQNPAVLQDMMNMMRNPAARQQMLQQQDLAMRNISNMPGGFQALSSMYHDMERFDDSMMPDMDATPSSGNSSTNPASSAAGATGTPMPNPWGRSSPSVSASSSSPSTNAAGRLGGDLDFIQSLLQGPGAAATMPAWMQPPRNSLATLSSRDDRSSLLSNNPWAAAPATSTPASAVSLAPTANSNSSDHGIMNGLDFASLLQQMESNGLSAATTASSDAVTSSDTEQQQQLGRLHELGFRDDTRNMHALQLAQGNVNRAVEILKLSAQPLPKEEHSANGEASPAVKSPAEDAEKDKKAE